VAAGQFPKRIGQGEGDQEMRARKEQLLLPLEPLIGGTVLAFGTVAVLAGMIAILVVAAVFTVVDLAAKRFGTALFDGLHRTEMAVRHLVPELGSVLRAMDAEDLSHLYHDRSSMRRLMEAAAISCALTVRCV
jgi:hypothetical protein